MSLLPTIVIFECHWDLPPKQVIAVLLPQLRLLGYGLFASEVPVQLTSQQIIANQRALIASDQALRQIANEALSRADMRGFWQEKGVKVLTDVSDMSIPDAMKVLSVIVENDPYLAAERIRYLPAAEQLAEVHNRATRFSVDIRGIDVCAVEASHISVEERVARLAAVHDMRTKGMALKIEQMRKDQEGVIVLCGVGHAATLRKNFEARGVVWGRDVLPFYPHTRGQYGEGFPDVSADWAEKPEVREEAYLCTSFQGVRTVAERVVERVKALIIEDTTEVIGGTFCSRFLSELFAVPVKARRRPGGYVDLCLPNREDICARFTANGIETETEDNCLIVRNVNTDPVIRQIRAL